MKTTFVWPESIIGFLTFCSAVASAILLIGGCATITKVEYTPFAQTFQPRQEANVTHDAKMGLESKGYFEIGTISAFYPASEGNEKKVQGQLEEMLLRKVAEVGGDLVIIDGGYTAGERFLKDTTRCKNTVTSTQTQHVFVTRPTMPGSTSLSTTTFERQDTQSSRCVEWEKVPVYTHGLTAKGSVWRKGERPEEYLGKFTNLLDEAFAGDLARVKALIAAGSNVNAKDEKGVTPLMAASLLGHIEVVRALLAAKADVNAKDDEGTTALVYASVQGRVEVVRALLAAKADVNAKKKSGWTALKYASAKGHDEVVKLLKKAGARE